MTMPGRTDDAGMNGSEFAVRVPVVGGQPGDGSHRDVEHRRDPLDRVGDHGHVGARRSRTASPRLPFRAGRTLSPIALERRAPLVVVAEQRDPVERASRPGDRRRARRDSRRRGVPRPAVRSMPAGDAGSRSRALVGEERAARLLGVELDEEPVDQRLIADEAAGSPHRASGRRTAASAARTERRARFVQSALGLGVMHADDPHRVRVLLGATLRRPEHAFALTAYRSATSRRGSRCRPST